MTTAHLPPRDTMLEAFLEGDPSFDGVFLTAVRTTGIFCRTTCPARKPRPENVEFYPDARSALLAGYRPCRRCRPLRPRGTPPAWLRPLLEAVEDDPARRWSDDDLRARGLSPERVRRWFRRHHGMTFHAYSRARRLGEALGSIRQGEEVTRAAFASGYDSLSAFHEAFKQVVGATPTEARNAPVVTVTRIPTPLGPMVAAATDEALCLLEFADRRMLETQVSRVARRLGALFVPGDNAVLDRTAAQLGEYFGGSRRSFDVPLDLPGTPFQEAVWQALREVPHGESVAYGELARRIGRPSAVRAVARANGDNRVAVLVPCHRVVGADGALTGYGGGLWRKRALLALERGERSLDAAPPS